MKAPGQAQRTGITLTDLIRLFPDDAAAERFFTDERWPDGVGCPHCGSTSVQAGAKHPSMPYRCRGCGKRFSVKTGTVMEGSNLGCQTWALAAYLMTTNLKGVSSMKLHRDLGITQKSAWHLAHRLREVWAEIEPTFEGPVEADETVIGGRERNKHAHQKLHENWPAGKTTVAGVKDRATNRVSAAVVPATDARTLKRFVADRTDWLATVYHRRSPVLRGPSSARDGQALSRGVRERPGAHERYRELLVDVQTGLPRHLPPHEPQAHEPLRARVHGPAQRAAAGHDRSAQGNGQGDGGAAVAVLGSYRLEAYADIGMY